MFPSYIKSEKCFWEVDCDENTGDVTLLFTENETNTRRLFNVDNYTPYVRDAFHQYVIHGK